MAMHAFSPRCLRARSAMIIPRSSGTSGLDMPGNRTAHGKVRQLVAGVLGSLYLRVAADLYATHADIGLQIQALRDMRARKAARSSQPSKSRRKRLAVQISELQSRAKSLRSAKRNTNVLRLSRRKWV